MPNIIAVNSFRHGVGRSHITANLAALLSLQGQRVGIVDANFQAPSLHILFNLDEAKITYSLNDYLWGHCDIQQTAYNVTPLLGNNVSSTGLFLIPGNLNLGEIAQTLQRGHDFDLLITGLRELIEVLELDVLLLDTQHGLTEGSLFAVAISDVLVLLLRTDQQDYRGTGVTLQIARRLEVPRILLVVNEAPAMFDFDTVKLKLEQAYDCEVAAVLPHFEEMMALASAKIFVLQYPDHPLTIELQKLATGLSLS